MCPCQGTFKVWDLIPARAGVAHCLMSFRMEGLTGVLAPEQFDFIPQSYGVLTGNHKLGHFKVSCELLAWQVRPPTLFCV